MLPPAAAKARQGTGTGLQAGRDGAEPPSCSPGLPASCQTPAFQAPEPPLPCAQREAPGSLENGLENAPRVCPAGAGSGEQRGAGLRGLQAPGGPLPEVPAAASPAEACRGIAFHRSSFFQLLALLQAEGLPGWSCLSEREPLPDSWEENKWDGASFKASRNLKLPVLPCHSPSARPALWVGSDNCALA